MTEKIKSIYEDFAYPLITLDEYEKIVIKASKKRNNMNDNSYELLIKKEIIKFQNELVNKKKKLIIRLNESLVNTEYKDIPSYLNKLNNIFGRIQYILDNDIIVFLLKENQILLSFICKLFKDNENEILNGNMSVLGDNNLLILFMYVYSSINDISIKETEDIEINNISLNSALSIYLGEIRSFSVLSKEEERDLLKEIKKGNNLAYEKFVKYNLKLVVSIAKKYQNRGLDLEDLIEEGNMGLMNAILKYDLNKETRFSTYAIYWIREYIKIALASKGRNIRLPIYMYDKIVNYRIKKASLEILLKREPTDEEIANELNITVASVAKLAKIDEDTLSLNKPIGLKDDSEFGDLVKDPKESLENTTIKKYAKKEVYQLFDKAGLSEKEKKVIMYRFGFYDREYTLNEIGKIFGMSREGIRQIESKAIKKFRKYKDIKSFAVYMDNPREASYNIDKLLLSYQDNRYYEKSIKKGHLACEKEAKENILNIKTIYNYFCMYTKKQVDDMLLKLPLEARLLEQKKFLSSTPGINLDQLSKEEQVKYNSRVVPLMKRFLSNPSCKLRREYTKQDDNLNKLNLFEANLINLPYVYDSKFNLYLIDNLSYEEYLVVFLMLGLIDGYYYNTLEICNLTSYNEIFVTNTVKKTLELYNLYVNSKYKIKIKETKI